MGGAEANARLLREGVIVPEGVFAGERFILSGMRDDEIEEISEYPMIQYDETQLRLVFTQPAYQTFFRSVNFSQMLIAVKLLWASQRGWSR